MPNPIHFKHFITTRLKELDTARTSLGIDYSLGRITANRFQNTLSIINAKYDAYSDVANFFLENHNYRCPHIDFQECMVHPVESLIAEQEPSEEDEK